MRWEKIWTQVNHQLANITDDDNDEDNLHRVNDAKTIELFDHYRDLGTIMSKTNWDSKDYADRIKYINAIMDFDCGDDANCEQYKQVFKDTGIVHRKEHHVETRTGTEMVRVPPRKIHGNVGTFKLSPTLKLGGRQRIKRSKKSKKHSKKSRKSKSRRH